jgi:hypothetical protein
MNADLRSMIVEAEGRYLAEEELGKLRLYAVSMGDRIAAARRLERVEEAVVEEAARLFAERHQDYLSNVPASREKLARDMKLTLRYLALAHVRDDMTFFRKNFASWISELLRAIVEPSVLVAGQRCLRDALEARLDPTDARSFFRYLDVYIEELGR